MIAISLKVQSLILLFTMKFFMFCDSFMNIGMKKSKRAFSFTTFSSTGSTAIYVRDLDLSHSFNLPIISNNNDNKHIIDCDSPLLLLERNTENNHLQVVYYDKTQKNIEKPFSIDFNQGKQKIRSEATHIGGELVVKAMGGLKQATTSENLVWDLTAGIGRDSFILASAGFHVQLFERNKIIFALLDDAIQRLALQNEEVYNRIILYNVDATKYLIYNDYNIDCNNTAKDNINNSTSYIDSASLDSLTTSRPDIILLDPMYESGKVGKKSKVKKETQVLHRLLGQHEGADSNNNKRLLETARALAKSRVVVKRPLNASPLDNAVPHNTIKAGKSRFDIYFAATAIKFKT